MIFIAFMNIFCGRNNGTYYQQGFSQVTKPTVTILYLKYLCFLFR